MPDASNPAQTSMLRSPLRRARGLGSARTGSKQWWAQRLTAAALVPLTLWFVWSMLHLTNASQADVAAWLASPFRLSLMLALIIATFHHLQLGIQVVIEDYVVRDVIRLAAILAVKGLCIMLALICVTCSLILGLGS